jgi:glycosyltransferase involved in cell wall biosynthesis
MKSDATGLLFLNQYFPPDEAATSQLLGDLTLEAVRRGRTTRVVSSDRSYVDPSRRYARREVWNGVTVERVRGTAFGRSTRFGRNIDYLTYLAGTVRTALRGGKGEIVVGLSTPPILGALAGALARWRGSRSAYWVMDVYPDIAFELGAIKPNSLTGRMFSAMSRWALRSADLVIALGETMGARLREAGARNVVVVHNWADGGAIEPIAPSRSRYRQRRAWGDKLVVLYSGNHGLAHEFDTVLEAAARLKDEPVVFAFVGGGPRLGELRDAVARQQLPNVECDAPVARDALGDLLAAGDVHLVTLRPRLPGLLVPSKIYGILAAGRPTIYVGPPEGEAHAIVTRGCGTSIANGDVDGLVRAIRAYSRDAERRRREGEAARQLFDREFTKEQQTTRILDALQTLRNGHHDRGRG